ncbi:MAG TPA: cytochrome c3 family protein [Gemmatimonadales bacterium]|nr:cytochrome c3 family protein [Gemmatimonadales bacterium]
MSTQGGRLAVGTVLALFLSVPAAAQTGQPAASPAVPVVTDTAALPGPRQPIFFRHDVHAGKDKIPCLYCHYTVTVSSEPGIPSLETCMGCHRLISGSTPSHQAEIKKVRDAWANRTPPQWVRVHALPGFVHFPHMRHIKVLGTTACATCHGDIASVPQVSQVATLRMGWCITCHVQRKVSRDCTLCHY